MRKLAVLAVVLAMMTLSLAAGAETEENPIQLGLGDSVAWGFGASVPERRG